ncbi:hypothetical protein V8E36_004010 [Tilletia maclaganii]
MQGKVVHAVFYGGSFYGHSRPALVLAIKLLGLSPNLVISIPHVEETLVKMRTDTERLMVDEGLSVAESDAVRSRMRFVAITVPDDFIMPAEAELVPVCFVARHSAALVAYWERIHTEPQDLPAPAFMLIDIFTDFERDHLKKCSPSTPFYLWWSSCLTYFNFWWLPAGNGLGTSLHKALQSSKDPADHEEAYLKAWFDVSREVVNLYDSSPIYRHEHHPTMLDPFPGVKYLSRVAVRHLSSGNDGIIFNSGAWLEPNNYKQIKQAEAQKLIRPTFAVNAMIPAKLALQGGEAVPRVARDSIVAFMDEALAKEGPASLVYISWGSVGGPTNMPWQIDLLIDTLVTAKRRFVLSTACIAQVKTDETEGKIARAVELGLCATSSWVPQVAVLSHPALNVFVTHGGWNSTCEAMIAAAPCVFWPVKVDGTFIASMFAETEEPEGWQLYESRGPSVPDWRPYFFKDGPRYSQPSGELIPVPTGTPEALCAELERVIVREAAPGSVELKARKERMLALRERYLESTKKGGMSHQAMVGLLAPFGCKTAA